VSSDGDLGSKKSGERVVFDKSMLVYAVICSDAPSKMRLVQVLWQLLEKAEWQEDL